MSQDEKKFFRVNRFLLVALVMIGCSSGVVALVSSPEVLTKPLARLSFPEPLQKVQGYKTPTKTLAIIQEVPVESPVEVKTDEKKHTDKVAWGSCPPHYFMPTISTQQLQNNNRRFSNSREIRTVGVFSYETFGKLFYTP